MVNDAKQWVGRLVIRALDLLICSDDRNDPWIASQIYAMIQFFVLSVVAVQPCYYSWQFGTEPVATAVHLFRKKESWLGPSFINGWMSTKNRTMNGECPSHENKTKNDKSIFMSWEHSGGQPLLCAHRAWRAKSMNEWMNEWMNQSPRNGKNNSKPDRSLQIPWDWHWTYSTVVESVVQ